MKRILFLFVLALPLAVLNAQNINDGLRYATDLTNGSARYNALSGAFGALGGDLSAVAMNPAGSAIFLRNHIDFAFSVDDIDNEASYFGTTRNSGDNDVSFNHAGAVFVFDNYNEESDWKKFTIAVNYNQTQNFDNGLFVKGIGNNSISQFFLQQAQGIPLELLETRVGESISDLYTFLGETRGVAAQNAFLGFQGFIIDPVDNAPGNTQYISNVGGGSFDQEYTLVSQGYQGKYTLNFGAQYTENLFFGINLNSHVFDYDQFTFLSELNSNQASTVSGIGFENRLSSIGAGFSAQLGAIAKITNEFRIGLTYDTPTWYTISEETIQYLETDRTEAGQLINTVVDPGIINVFADYRLQTPGRIAASAAYVFGRSGLISFDYSYSDYSNIEFRPNGDPNFAIQNNLISDVLKGASTFRVGGEYRIEQLSLRGGFHYVESPYQDETTVGDLTGYSGGIGYNFGNFTLDASYVRQQQDRNQQLYNIGLTDTAAVTTATSNIVLSLGLSL